MKTQKEFVPKSRVLIVGGAHGIGRALAEHVAGQGVELILADHDGPALHAAANALGAHGIFCDVLSEASVEVFCAYLEARFDAIDLLINAAGNKYVRTLGMVRMSVAIMPLLRRSAGDRCILNVASAEHFNNPGSPFSYASSRESFLRCSQALLDRVSSSSISVSTIVLSDDAGAGEAPSFCSCNGIPCGGGGADRFDLDRLADHVSRLVTPGTARVPLCRGRSAGRAVQ